MVEGEGIQGEWGNKGGLLLRTETAPDRPKAANLISVRLPVERVQFSLLLTGF